MKKTITLLVALLFLGFNSFAQQDEECMTKLSIFTEYAKAKNYDAAFEPWMRVREKCPKLHRAIYKYGEDILEDKIKKASNGDKIPFINDLIKLWEQRAQYYPNKTPKGEYIAKKARLLYDHRELLNKNKEELYQGFDDAFKTDFKTFTSPKNLYIYFSLMVDLYDAGKKPAQDLFNKYDDVIEKLEVEEKINSEGLNKILKKEESGTALTKKDRQYEKMYSGRLANINKIAPSVDALLGDRANCSNLVPLYQKGYEQNKNNEVWLQRAIDKLYQKGCKNDPMFVKIVKQKNSVAPNANTSYYLYIITGEQQYFNQTLSLETDPYKKAKLFKKIAVEFKGKGQYGKAREYFKKAMELNPSDKKPYESIARMYASSANNCGTDSFNKRAVFWLAAKLARQAGNSSLAANYEAKAPSKSDVFNKNMAGKTIKIGCWIGRSVKVPGI